jgi:hypothetical protein
MGACVNPGSLDDTLPVGGVPGNEGDAKPPVAMPISEAVWERRMTSMHWHWMAKMEGLRSVRDWLLGAAWPSPLLATWEPVGGPSHCAALLLRGGGSGRTEDIEGAWKTDSGHG